MKIEAVDFFYLSMPVVTTEGDGSQDALLVRVAAGGHMGWGECEASPLVSIAAFVCPMSHGACRPVGDAVLGQALDTPDDIARIARQIELDCMDLLQAPHTWSGVEMALWDLLGKVRSEPVWRLLGYKNAFRKLPYASQLFGDSPSDTLRLAKEASADRFRAVKFGWGPIGRSDLKTDVDHFQAAREGLGPKQFCWWIPARFLAKMSKSAAKRLPALEAVGAKWLEEPFHTGALNSYGTLARLCKNIKLAGGEGAHNFYMAQHLIDFGHVGYIQVDCGRIGGIGPAKRVADYAVARGVTFVNHTFTSHLALSASLQPYAGLREHEICEFPFAPKPLAREFTANHFLRELLAAASSTRTVRAAIGEAIGFPWALPASNSAGVPRLVVEEFSKPFDPAYLSNGLIGIRPGPNPLARAQTCVSGFVFSHPLYRMEALSPAPYPLETDVRVNDVGLLSHPELFKIQRQSLEMASGELLTEATFSPGEGIRLQMEILQFASRSVPSLLCQEIRVISSQDIEIKCIAAINCDDLPGALYFSKIPERTPIDLVIGVESEGDLQKLGVALMLVCPDEKLQKEPPSLVNNCVRRAFRFKTQAGRPFYIRTIAAMISGLYHPEPSLEAIRLANWGGMLGFEKLREDNRAAWEDLWKSRVQIVGDFASQRVLDAAHFYLHSSLHPSTRTGMPPFGLSQWDHYFGHSFWDTESWSLLPVTLASPATGRALVDFRLRGLENARKQASLYGFRGAQFPWEAAQTSGYETTPTFAATGWGEQHATPDVALGVWEYQLATNDREFLREGTWPILHAVAEWIMSRGTFTARGFELRNIMGPDEGVGNINNSSYMQSCLEDGHSLCHSVCGNDRLFRALVMEEDSRRFLFADG